MAIPAKPTITAPPNNLPTRGEDPTTFSNNINNLVAWYPDLTDNLVNGIDWMDVVFTEVETEANNAASSAALAQDWAEGTPPTGQSAKAWAEEAETTRDNVLSNLNFVGEWSAQTGAANVPYAVYHDGFFWQLLQDLADVTTVEPGTDPGTWALTTGVPPIAGKTGKSLTVIGGAGNEELSFELNIDIGMIVFSSDSAVFEGYLRLDDSTVLRSSYPQLDSWAQQYGLDFLNYESTIENSGVSSSLFGIAFDGTTYVAVGVSGEVLTSTDLSSWSTQTSGTSNVLNDVVHGGTEFVAVGDNGTIITSPDGSSWTTQTSGTANDLEGVFYDGSGNLIAVGASGTIITSTDGVSWTDQTSGTTTRLEDCAFDGTSYVVVGNSGEILTSSNLTAWNSETSGTVENLFDVTHDGTEFIAVGLNGTIITSPDGSSWTTQTSGSTEALFSIVSAFGLRLVVGSNGELLSSQDRVNWTSESSASTESLQRIVDGNNEFGIVGTIGEIISYSLSDSLTLNSAGESVYTGYIKAE